jgi:hypothetical protein
MNYAPIVKNTPRFRHESQGWLLKVSRGTRSLAGRIGQKIR